MPRPNVTESPFALLSFSALPAPFRPERKRANNAICNKMVLTRKIV
jgi:hypothetical protein